jgi:hypothetical protein
VNGSDIWRVWAFGRLGPDHPFLHLLTAQGKVEGHYIKMQRQAAPTSAVQVPWGRLLFWPPPLLLPNPHPRELSVWAGNGDRVHWRDQKALCQLPLPYLLPNPVRGWGDRTQKLTQRRTKKRKKTGKGERNKRSPGSVLTEELSLPCQRGDP